MTCPLWLQVYLNTRINTVYPARLGMAGGAHRRGVLACLLLIAAAHTALAATSVSEVDSVSSPSLVTQSDRSLLQELRTVQVRSAVWSCLTPPQSAPIRSLFRSAGALLMRDARWQPSHMRRLHRLWSLKFSAWCGDCNRRVLAPACRRGTPDRCPRRPAMRVTSQSLCPRLSRAR